MAYRDAHGNDMQDEDWREIEARLHASYRLLKRAIAGKAR